MFKAAVACTLALYAVGAMAGTWNVLNDQFATIALAITCSDANTCIAPVGLNGQGSFIWLTTNGGQTWNPEQDAFELMLLGAAMSKTDGSAVVADELTLIYNNASAQNEYMFSHPKSGDYFVTSQNVEVFGGSSYGAAGQSEGVNNGNGVAISTNGGAAWTWYNVSILNTFARYGAYPSATTWFLSAGEWPTNKNPATEDTYRELSSRVHINQNSEGELGVKLFPSDRQALPVDAGWKAQIVKTTDGGKTWVSQFYDETFYFNQIGCTDVNHCCAVGEADTGICFYCTWDGGNTWTRTLYLSNPDLSDLSVRALRFIDSNNGWAAGGALSASGITGYFWQTTDGGKTWTNQTVPGQFGIDISFPTPTKGFAVAFNQEEQSSLLVFQ